MWYSLLLVGHGNVTVLLFSSSNFIFVKIWHIDNIVYVGQKKKKSLIQFLCKQKEYDISIVLTRFN